MQGARERETFVQTHDFASDPGLPSPDTMRRAKRALLEAWIEAAIACLDALDGDPDFEDDGCAEVCHRASPQEMPPRAPGGSESVDPDIEPILIPRLLVMPNGRVLVGHDIVYPDEPELKYPLVASDGLPVPV